MEADDVAAVNRVIGGETEAFGDIVKRNYRRLFAFGRRFFGNVLDIEDFVQDVFLQAYRKLYTYRQEARFTSWLLSIAYHIAVNQLRREHRDEAIEEDLSDARGNPEMIALRRETGRLVVEAMRRLPERFATCLDLHFFFGQTYEEISVMTGHPINTVRSHIRRAKALLRPALAGELSEECYGLS